VPQPAPEGSSAAKRLSPCVKNLLGLWFSEIDLSKITTYDYKPAYVLGDAGDYTEGTNIFFRDGIDQHSIDGIVLIGHELTHVRQEIRYPYTYAVRYGAAGAREIRHGRDPAGRGNPFEREAQDMASKKTWRKEFSDVRLHTHGLQGLNVDGWVDPDLRIENNKKSISVESAELRTTTESFSADIYSNDSTPPSKNGYHLPIAWRFEDERTVPEVLGQNCEIIVNLKIGEEPRQIKIEYEKK